MHKYSIKRGILCQSMVYCNKNDGGLIMGLFSRKGKNGKKWCVLYMHCSLSGKLHDVVDSMNEGPEYLKEPVRMNFIQVMHPAELKKYGAKNMTGYFPDQWPSPVYVKNKENFDDTARQCVRDFIKIEMPDVDIDSMDIAIQLHADGDFASASFEY